VSAQGITTFYSENFSLTVVEKEVIGEWLMTSGLWPSRLKAFWFWIAWDTKIQNLCEKIHIFFARPERIWR